MYTMNMAFFKSWFFFSFVMSACFVISFVVLNVEADKDPKITREVFILSVNGDEVMINYIDAQGFNRIEEIQYDEQPLEMGQKVVLSYRDQEAWKLHLQVVKFWFGVTMCFLCLAAIFAMHAVHQQ
jgi:hypothetical protein